MDTNEIDGGINTRQTFRQHPFIIPMIVKNGNSATYEPVTNIIEIGANESVSCKTVVHELTHWAMTGFFTNRELRANDAAYTALQSKHDRLTLYQLSIEERTADYIEGLIDE